MSTPAKPAAAATSAADADKKQQKFADQCAAACTKSMAPTLQALEVSVEALKLQIEVISERIEALALTSAAKKAPKTTSARANGAARTGGRAKKAAVVTGDAEADKVSNIMQFFRYKIGCDDELGRKFIEDFIDPHRDEAEALSASITKKAEGKDRDQATAHTVWTKNLISADEKETIRAPFDAWKRARETGAANGDEAADDDTNGQLEADADADDDAKTPEDD